MTLAPAPEPLPLTARPTPLAPVLESVRAAPPAVVMVVASLVPAMNSPPAAPATSPNAAGRVYTTPPLGASSRTFEVEDLAENSRQSPFVSACVRSNR